MEGLRCTVLGLRPHPAIAHVVLSEWHAVLIISLGFRKGAIRGASHPRILPKYDCSVSSSLRLRRRGRESISWVPLRPLPMLPF